MVHQELDICCKYASEPNFVFLHERKQLIIFLDLQIICIFQSRRLLRLRIDLNFTADGATLQVKDALDGIGVPERECV